MNLRSAFHSSDSRSHALAILAFSTKTPKRRPLVIASSLVLGWLVYLRTGWFFAPLSWALILGTVGVTVALRSRLRLSQRGASR